MAERPLPTTILPTLGYLLKLLGSPRDGEALGAARAIARKLAGAGLDLHDFAAHVEGRAVPAAPPSAPAPAPRPKSRRAEAWRPPVHVHLSRDERAALRARLADALCEAALKGFDRVNLAALADRLDHGQRPPTQKMVDRAEAVIAGLKGFSA